MHFASPQSPVWHNFPHLTENTHPQVSCSLCTADMWCWSEPPPLHSHKLFCLKGSVPQLLSEISETIAQITGLLTQSCTTKKIVMQDGVWAFSVERGQAKPGRLPSMNVTLSKEELEVRLLRTITVLWDITLDLPDAVWLLVILHCHCLGLARCSLAVDKITLSLSLKYLPSSSQKNKNTDLLNDFLCFVAQPPVHQWFEFVSASIIFAYKWHRLLIPKQAVTGGRRGCWPTSLLYMPTTMYKSPKCVCWRMGCH